MLLLDFDGTIVPLAPTPDAVRLPERTRRRLTALAASGYRLIVVSGRGASEVRRHLQVPDAIVYGSHGLEAPGRRGPAIRREVAARLHRLEGAARDLARDYPGALVETKPAGVAFHDRALEPRLVVSWRRAVGRLLRASDVRGLELLRGHRVLELRPREARKGVVVRRWVGRRRRFDASIVALGDDRTDEDMFAALGTRGLSVKVGQAPTQARLRLATQADVTTFLGELARLAAARPHHANAGEV